MLIRFLNFKWQEEEDVSDPNYRFRKMDAITKSTLAELEKSQDAAQAGTSTSKSETKVSAKADIFNAANYSTGRAAASLTSTVMEPITKVEAAILSDDAIKYQRVKGKGYCQLITSVGTLNLELQCDQTPKACDNFLRLCRSGYYDGTIFHRLIKNFMVQGGDPTGTGKGGQSIFGAPFEDEFRQHLSHSGRGILCMANSGPDTNKSQFYLTFRSCKHLDKKHTVFGRLVGGMETLEKIEKAPCDAKDRPLEAISIKSSVIFKDPFEDVLSNITEERSKLESARKGAQEKAKPKLAAKQYRAGVGSFIDLSTLTGREEASNLLSSSSSPNASSTTSSSSSSANKKISAGTSKFGNFQAW